MRALRILGTDGPASVTLGDVAEPRPGEFDVLVTVHASGLNRADLLQAKGLYPAPPGFSADIPGLEYAGVVSAVGERVTRFKPGDRVMGIVPGAAHAERVCAHEGEVLPVPASLTLEEAAAVPEAFGTALDALVVQGGLAPGGAVLIHAAGSGVGTAAIQLVAAMGGRAIGTARSAAKLERCRPLGLAHGIVCADRAPRFAQEVLEVTGGRGVDVALELVAGAYLRETLACCAPRARVLVIGLLGGARSELDARVLLTQRLSLIGSVLRSRSLEERCALAEACARGLVPLLESRAVRPVVDAVIPVERAQEALARLGENQTFGKLVLRW